MDHALFIACNDDTWLTTADWQEMVWHEVCREFSPAKGMRLDNDTLPDLRDVDLMMMGQ